MSSKINLEESYKTCKEKTLFGRYITNSSIKPLLDKLKTYAKVDVIGRSVNNLPIYGIKIGNGKKKILMWSQMHGNESTTTKALFDALNTIKSKPFKNILNSCTLYIIPILNPDGALAYTRLNANAKDLNRDAQNLTQPESHVLKETFSTFQPDFCLNLHGQRTIFSVGQTNKPATVSFLAPAQDKECTITNNRKRAMELIAIMNKELQQIVPNQIGIYDDAFNINCVGDTFQTYNVPTVLFEAGHINQDYNREEVRQYIYIALMSLIDYVSDNDVLGDRYLPYLNIPENGKQFYDIIIRNAALSDAKEKSITDIAIQFEETLLNNTIDFIPKVHQINGLNTFYGHREIDAENNLVKTKNKPTIIIGDVINSVVINTKEFLLKPIINR